MTVGKLIPIGNYEPFILEKKILFALGTTPKAVVGFIGKKITEIVKNFGEGRLILCFRLVFIILLGQ